MLSRLGLGEKCNKFSIFTKLVHSPILSIICDVCVFFCLWFFPPPLIQRTEVGTRSPSHPEIKCYILASFKGRRSHPGQPFSCKEKNYVVFLLVYMFFSSYLWCPYPHISRDDSGLCMQDFWGNISHINWFYQLEHILATFKIVKQKLV